MSKFAAVLLSRQPLRPSGKSAWVRGAVAALTWLRKQGYGLVGSSGMQTWELVTALAVLEQCPLKLVVPAVSMSQFFSRRDALKRQFALDSHLTEFVPVVLSGRESSGTALMSARDRSVVELADLLVPVSVRGEGNMASLIADAEASGMIVNRDFVVPYEDRQEPLALVISPDSLNPEIEDLEADYITHWTRATNDRWPDERIIDLYRAVVTAASWPRSGFDTLSHIVHSQRLMASSRNMPGKEPVVSFSSLPPREVAPLMRWRARYGRMSFEPYGLGIEKQIALEKGIHPVAYYGKGDEVKLPPDLMWLSQSEGKISDWRTEKEYRHRGNFYMDGIPREAVVLFCHTADEAELLHRRFGYRVIPFLPSTINRDT